ncbi:hypothetical protein RD792_006134 [Penstemon davidsonii]|uniref:LRAT domain-containing protein n=1 Tax=Penstemon davidsonii TaxID=160366 RepID=A0ABR0DEK8_9LAMI|nr:hypothetical protein RD792_006134 [Penstemon davidsonii]
MSNFEYQLCPQINYQSVLAPDLAVKELYSILLCDDKDNTIMAKIEKYFNTQIDVVATTTDPIWLPGFSDPRPPRPGNEDPRSPRPWTLCSQASGVLGPKSQTAGGQGFGGGEGVIYTQTPSGIYVGENLVVHFINPDRNSFANSSFTCSSSLITNFPTTCSNPCCDLTKEKNGVTISCLDCFLGNGSLYRYQYGVSWYTRMAKVRDGTCTSAKSDPEDIVVHRAKYLLHHGFGDYDVIKNNCEDFALYCKFGRLMSGDKNATSGQVLSFLRAPAAVIVSSPLQLFMSTPVTLATTMVMYNLGKYRSDIGVRDDLIEVEVEELAKFRANRNQLKND